MKTNEAKQEDIAPKLTVVKGAQVDLVKWVAKFNRQTPPKHIHAIELGEQEGPPLPKTVNEDYALTVWATIRKVLKEEKADAEEMRDHFKDFRSWLCEDAWFVDVVNAGHLAAAANWFLDAHEDGSDGEEGEDEED